MSVQVRYRPGIQLSPSLNASDQRAAIAAELDRLQIRVQLGNRALSGSELAALPLSGLPAGMRSNDLWELLDDVAHPDNQGQVIDVRAGRTLAQRYGLTDAVDNYSSIIVNTPRGAASLGDVARIQPETFRHAEWYHYLYEWFLELFSVGFYQSLVFDEPNRQEQAGRALFDQAPATASALLQDTTALRAYLVNQRPQNGMSPGQWSDVVDNLIQGLRERSQAVGQANIEIANSLPSMPARDAFVVAYRAADAATRTRLLALRDLCASLSAPEAEALITPLPTSTAARDFVLNMADTIRHLPAVVRNEAASIISSIRTTEEANSFAALLSSPAFTNSQVSDVDRREALVIYQRAEQREALPELLNTMATEAWRTSSPETRQRLLSIASAAGSQEALAAISRLWRSAPIAALTVDQRNAASSALAQMPSLLQRTEPVERFLAALAPLAEDVRNEILTGLGNDDDFAGWLNLATMRFPSEASVLQRVLFGNDTLSLGSTGHAAVVVQRYLQAFRTNDPITREEVPRYVPLLGAVQRPTFDEATKAALTQFQRDHNIVPTDGRLTRHTLMALIRALPNQTGSLGTSPSSSTYFTTVNLNRPTASTDGSWRATQRWTPELEQQFQTFSGDYMRTRFNTGERLDCADLALETVVVFARLNGLPLELSNGGGRVIRHSSSGIRIAQSARAYLGAINIPNAGNTVPVPIGSGRASDIGIMDWDQSLDGRDSAYNHTYPIVGWDNAEPSNTFLIYGSLTDDIEPSRLQAFNDRHRLSPPLTELSEYNIIDAINPDPQSEDRRRPPEVYRPRIAAALRPHLTTDATEAQIDEVVAMVRQATRRDQPTQIYSTEGVAAYSSITSRDLYSDLGVLNTELGRFNQRFATSITTAQARQLLRAGDDEEASALARTLLSNKVPAAQLDAAVTTLVKAVNDSRCLRRWNFAAWNRFVQN